MVGTTDSFDSPHQVSHVKHVTSFAMKQITSSREIFCVNLFHADFPQLS